MRPDLLFVSGQDNDGVAVGERQRNESGGFQDLASLVDEDVSEMTLRYTNSDQAGSRLTSRDDDRLGHQLSEGRDVEDVLILIVVAVCQDFAGDRCMRAVMGVEAKQ